jgi:hypothetical protein
VVGETVVGGIGRPRGFFGFFGCGGGVGVFWVFFGCGFFLVVVGRGPKEMKKQRYERLFIKKSFVQG